MTPEELDEARAEEALRIWNEEDGVTDEGHAVIAARLAREGWTPPEPVDPDLIAVLEFLSKRHPGSNYYHSETAKIDALTQTCLAAYKAGRNQERERANPVVQYVQGLTTLGSDDSISAISWGARATLSKYRGEV